MWDELEIELVQLTMMRPDAIKSEWLVAADARLSAELEKRNAYRTVGLWSPILAPPAAGSRGIYPTLAGEA